MIGANVVIGNPPLVTGLGGVSNFKPSNTRRLRKAKANVFSGTARAVIGFCGDSTSMGSGAGSGTNGLDGARAKRHTKQIEHRLHDATYFPVHDLSWMGSNGVPGAQQATYDTRISIGAGWATTSAGIAGAYYQNSTTTNALAFTPVETFDTLEIWYIQFNGGGTFTVDIDGGSALETINTGSPATNGFIKKTYTVSLGAHTINFKRTTGGNTRIAGWTVYDSSKKDLELRNLGVSGATAATVALTTNPWSNQNAHVAMAMDAVCLNVGINDWGLTDIAAFEASIDSYLDAVGAVSDIIGVLPSPQAISLTTLANQMLVVNALKRQYRAHDVPVIDLRSLFETYEISNALGEYYNTTHPNALGYSIMGDILAAVIASA